MSEQATSRIKHTSLGEKTYRKIKESILNGKYSPGDRLMYEKLTRALAVSQTPLREAFVRLEKEGLLETVPHRGTFVKELSPRDIVEIFLIRSMLEALAARLACGTAGAEDIARLKLTCATFKRHIEKKNLKQCIRSDFLFHEMIIKLSDNIRLESMVDSFNLHNFSFFESGPDYFPHARRYLQDHLALTDAIAGKEQDEAERIMRAHIEYGRDNVLRFLETRLEEANNRDGEQ